MLQLQYVGSLPNVTGRGWQQELNLVTAAGHQAILSAPWYLNYIKYGSDWVKFYKVDPSSFGGNSTQQELLLGGEVSLKFTLSLEGNNTLLAFRSVFGANLSTPSTPFQDCGLVPVQRLRFYGLKRPIL